MSSGAVRMPAAATAGVQRVAVGRAVRGRRWRAGRCRHGGRKASATVSRSGSAKGSASRPRKAKRSRRPHRRPARAASAQSRHQRLIGLAGAVPFQHGEFGMVQRAALAVAVDRPEAEDALARRRRAASCRRIPARCAGRALRASPSGRIASVAKADRCVSLPGETCSAAVCTSTKSRRANQPRNAPRRWRCARAGEGGGRRGGRAPTRAKGWS